jgi:hypothetical protein
MLTPAPYPPLRPPSAVVQSGRRCFSFLSVSYGLITNLDIGTEHLRCVVACLLLFWGL